ncbi:TetR/AcrR family transcriptional regulator [Streptomyces sp. NBC_01217]|uniref:TetR/AcrR family transcriptional regulator n=1 Tax=Streptomyces sp. NBC_01217 TaxID=2903779 RepID=UPI002E122C34|nr:TetR/AcrR family transcriptional regulator [Streptomyces sp. NBC_01217]
MPPLTSKGIATRQRIVVSAAALMRELGAANASLDDIRAATATSKSQLFHYFPNGKSELLLAVARHEADQVLAEQQPFLGDLTSWSQWEAWRDQVIANYASQRDSCPLSALTAQLGMAHPGTNEVITDLYDRWRGHLSAGVRALVERGEARPETDPDATAIVLLGVISGGATMLHATDSLEYLEVGLDQAMRSMRTLSPQTSAGEG